MYPKGLHMAWFVYSQVRILIFVDFCEKICYRRTHFEDVWIYLLPTHNVQKGTVHLLFRSAKTKITISMYTNKSLKWVSADKSWKGQLLTLPLTRPAHGRSLPLTGRHQSHICKNQLTGMKLVEYLSPCLHVLTRAQWGHHGQIESVHAPLSLESFPLGVGGCGWGVGEGKGARH